MTIEFWEVLAIQVSGKPIWRRPAPKLQDNDLMDPSSIEASAEPAANLCIIFPESACEGFFVKKQPL